LVDVHHGGQRQQHQQLRALHVGCGTSTLGESLLLEQSFGISSVVNTDCDRSYLEKSRLRWEHHYIPKKERTDALNKTMEYRHTDYSLPETAVAADEEFDLTIDKSTLDCLLCTDAASANLLCHVSTSVKPLGVYVLISFHYVDFLRPLLGDLPSSDWDVSFHVIARQVGIPGGRGKRTVNGRPNNPMCIETQTKLDSWLHDHFLVR